MPPGASHPIPSPDRNHAPKRLEQHLQLRTLRVIKHKAQHVCEYYVVGVCVCASNGPLISNAVIVRKSGWNFLLKIKKLPSLVPQIWWICTIGIAKKISPLFL